jgi:hypothetical protein
MDNLRLPYSCLRERVVASCGNYTESMPTRGFHDPPVVHLLLATCTQFLEAFNFCFHIVGFDIQMKAALAANALQIDLQPTPSSVRCAPAFRRG